MVALLESRSIRMVCWALRTSLIRLILAGLLCLVMVGGAAMPPAPPTGESDAGSISLRPPELPLAAVAATSGVRLEHQAQSVRLTLHRPDRSGALASIAHTHAIQFSPRVSRMSRILARRLLAPRRSTLCAPRDSSEPFPASSVLS